MPTYFHGSAYPNFEVTTLKCNFLYVIHSHADANFLYANT